MSRHQEGMRTQWAEGSRVLRTLCCARGRGRACLRGQNTRTSCSPSSANPLPRFSDEHPENGPRRAARGAQEWGMAGDTLPRGPSPTARSCSRPSPPARGAPGWTIFLRPFPQVSSAPSQSQTLTDVRERPHSTQGGVKSNRQLATPAPPPGPPGVEWFLPKVISLNSEELFLLLLIALLPSLGLGLSCQRETIPFVLCPLWGQ